MLDYKAETAEATRHTGAIHTVDTDNLLVILECHCNVLLSGVVRVVLRESVIVLILEAHGVNETLLTVVARECRDLPDLLRFKLDCFIVAILLTFLFEDGRLGSITHFALH